MEMNEEKNGIESEIQNAESEKKLNDFAKNLKAELLLENNENKTGNESVINDDKTRINFTCPNNILDFLEDKPYKVIDFLLLASQKATKDEIKEIQQLFPINDSDKALSRPLIKKMIEDFVSENPELAKFFSEENLFFLRLITRELEISSALKSIRLRSKVESGN